MDITLSENWQEKSAGRIEEFYRELRTSRRGQATGAFHSRTMEKSMAAAKNTKAIRLRTL